MPTLDRYQQAQCDGAMAWVREDTSMFQEGARGLMEPAWMEAYVIGWVFGT